MPQQKIIDDAEVDKTPSVDDIAGMLFTHSTPKGVTDDNDDKEPLDAAAKAKAAAEAASKSASSAGESDDEEDEQDDDGQTTTDENDEENDGIQSKDDASEDGEELAAQDDDSEQYLDIQDDDTFEVKIDGETVTRTIGEAKAALSGEGAIQKRLKAATLEKQATAQDRLVGLQDLEQKRTEFNNYVQSLDGELFKPVVAPPDESLRASDTSAYLDQIDLYKADQKRIVDGRAQLAVNIQEQQKQQAANLKQLQREQGIILSEKLPGLADKEKAPKIQKAISDAADYYGFLPAEVSMVADHRIFLMAYDAAQFRALKAKASSKGEVLDLKTNTRPARKLRSGAHISRSRTLAKQSAKVSKNIADKARSTGKVDDILPTIMKPAG